MKKNAIYLTFSVIFLALSALGIGWLVKQEIEKGKQENQEQNLTISRKDSSQEKDFPNGAEDSDQEIVIQNKDDANKVLNDVESLMNSTEQDNLPAE